MRMSNNEIIELPPTDMAESSFAAVRAVSLGARTFISIASTVSLAGGVALGNYILVPSIQASSNSTLEAAGVGATRSGLLPAGTHLDNNGVLVDVNGVPVSSDSLGTVLPLADNQAGSAFYAAASKAFRKNGTFGLTVTPEVAKLVTDLAVVVAAGDQSEIASPSASPTASALTEVLAATPAESTTTVELAQAVLDSLPAIDMAVLDFHSNVSTATPGGGNTTDYLTKASNASASAAGVANAAGNSAAASAGTTSNATQAAGTPTANTAGAASYSGGSTSAAAAGSSGVAAGTTSNATQAASAPAATGTASAGQSTKGSGNSTSSAAAGSTSSSSANTSNATQAASTGSSSGSSAGSSTGAGSGTQTRQSQGESRTSESAKHAAEKAAEQAKEAADKAAEKAKESGNH
jgi:hypothetical protein